MWHLVRTSAAAEIDLAGAIRDLLESTSRWIISVVGLVLVLSLIAGVVWPDELSPGIWAVVPITVFTCVVSLSLLPYHFALAQVIWQVGLMATLVSIIRVFSIPEVAFFSVLLPMMAVVTLGWPLALGSQVLVTLLALWLYRGLVTPAPPPSYAWIIIIGGMMSWAMAWAVIHSLITATEWSLYSYREARENVEEARNQRLELAQSQEDLIKANRELARMADRLRTISQIADEARQAKEQFVANVSHELRTPLNMIIGFSEMITQTPQIYGERLPPALLADITAIQRNSQHLSKLVNDVLDLSQIEADRMTLSKDWTDVRDIIDEAITAVTLLYSSRGLYLKTEVASDLPLVLCDETRVRQVLLNLLSNAGRFTEHGGVCVSARQQNTNILISVCDTGLGIAEADRNRLFEPFRQLDSSIRRKHEGSGLGLSISKRFVEMHGGEMWLESEVGVGTTFYFSLPVEMPLSTDLANRDVAQRWFNPYQEYLPRTRRWKAPAPEFVPRYVVLERGTAMRDLLTLGLEQAEVVGVQSIDGAFEEMRRSPARALIVNAPSQETFGITQEWLEALPYRTPAIVSWLPDAQDVAHTLGVFRYLTKPVTREELLEVLPALGDHVQTILLVDDDAEALQLFSRMLASASPVYDVLLAKGGQRALDLLRRRHPDVVLLDLVMPGVDGFQVLKEMQADAQLRDIPVIIMSSRDPTGQLIVSDTLSMVRGGGMSVRDLLSSIEALGVALTPSRQADRQAQSETPGA